MGGGVLSVVDSGCVFLTRQELATRWGVGLATLDREVRRGLLAKTKLAGRVKFSLAEVERYERENTAVAA